MAKPILYSFWRSSCSWRLRIAMQLKNIDYELRTVDIAEKKTHLTDEYWKINPMKKVPALVIDNDTLVESMNIIYYLEETFPERYSLLPENKMQRARVREISEMIVSGIQPLQNVGLREVPILSNEKELYKFASHWIRHGLSAVETIVKNTSGEYCVGDDITMADCCLVPQIYNAKKFRVDLSDYPTLVRIAKKLEENPAFSDTHPHLQPDAPEKLPRMD